MPGASGVDTTPHVDAHGFEIAERSLRFCFARPHQRLQNRRAVGTSASAPDRIPDVCAKPATRSHARNEAPISNASFAVFRRRSRFEDRSRIIMTPLPEQRATEADGGMRDVSGMAEGRCRCIGQT